MAGKTRIDQWLVEAGIFPSREKAQRAVLAGLVFVGSERVAKPSRSLTDEETAAVRVTAVDPAVSRGYHKLAKALDAFAVDPRGRVCVDVGSSTGGFTQVLLDRGARLVYAVDSGTNQLDYSLRRDPRVAVMEKTNARLLAADALPERPTLAVMDVSFISVTLLFPVLAAMPGLGELVVLVKPQFEAGRDAVGKGGIVRDAATHRRVLGTVIDAARAAGLATTHLDWSPLSGATGNIEFLARFARGETGGIAPERIDDVVADAHRAARAGELAGAATEGDAG